MINDALRMVRVFHDLRQNELAKKLQIAPSYLSEIENGKKQPTLQLLNAYATEFEMPLSSIMFFAEQMESSRAGRARTSISRKAIALLNFIAEKAGRIGVQ